MAVLLFHFSSTWISLYDSVLYLHTFYLCTVSDIDDDDDDSGGADYNDDVQWPYRLRNDL